jgi:Ala-tRNA(Pro) deacylase
MDRRLEAFLGAKQARYEVIPHGAAVTAQEQAAASHTPGRAMAKVVIVKERDGYVMAVVPAACVVDLDRLKGLIGHGDIRLATTEEIHAAVPNWAPGAIPPLGPLHGLRAYVDRALLDAPDVTMPAGDPGSAIRVSYAEFHRLADGVVGDFAVPEALVPEPVRTTAARPPGRRARRPARAPRAGRR